MPIFGTALLGICHLLGIVLGDLLCIALGMNTNVGGVGIAMLPLISARIYLNSRGKRSETSEGGVHYWGALYIPVVVAMAMVFGGLAGTVSGVSAGLAATDRSLVPYGTLVATFHTGLGCLLGPSLLFLAVKTFL